MSHRIRVATFAVLFASLLAGAGAPRVAEAGAEAALALAAPLAEQFGVPASAVQGLLQSGVSLESATQLLLVSQVSKTELGDVADLYRGQGSDITKTAEHLGVDPSAYAKDKATAAIDKAKASVADSATQGVKDEASKKLGDALGGFKR